MPLPPNGVPWPPRELANVTPSMQQWSAWYEGSPEALRQVYSRANDGAYNPLDARVQAMRDATHGGVRRMLQRFWWGRPIRDLTQVQRDMLHVPIASDLCQASADLLFSDQPTITAKSADTQKRLEEIADDGLYSTLAESAEVAAALGGVYLRVVWDKDLRADAPFLTAVDADCAIPEFRWGKLIAVTFWKIVDAQGQNVWRHLERHELDPSGVGVIQHALYQGTNENLGRVVPLADKPATQVFVKALNADGIISTESPGLAVTYIPNQRPQRRWRSDPLGAHLGRSDLDGVEGLMDALDETYSSWMRDIRLGKARILVAQSMLERGGPGGGAMWDAEQEVYSPLNVPPTTGGTGLPVEEVQFKIRYEEHAATAQQLLDDIVRTAGYSTQTFGEGDASLAGMRTATEVEQRERRSLLTRDRKIRHWRPGIADALEKLLAVDVALFSGGYTVERPDVAFTDGVQESQLALAQTAQALSTARAASTKTLVQLVHPDWDDKDVDVEVALISAEEQAANPPMPDPTTFDGAGDPAADPPVEPAAQ